MAYAFRIHEPKNPGDPAPTSAANMSGWTETSHIAGYLLRNIPLGQNNNKMGTSIPSLFARIFLFEGAFQTLSGADINQLRLVNADTTLVSECLDLIEFVYQHGNDSHLIIKHWNATEQIQNLKQDGVLEHKKLAKVLEDEIHLYPQLKDIFLFFWKSATPQNLQPQEILIGGTSPYTLVFTSPNWSRSMSANQLNFTRLNGNPLFGNVIEPLVDRDTAFKDMLYSMHYAYNTELPAQASSFNRYLATSCNADVIVAPSATTKTIFINSFISIKDNSGTGVFAHSLPLCYKKVSPTASGYEIIPKSQRYVNYDRDNNNNPLPIPLALNENGLNGASYIGTSVWKKETCEIKEAEVRQKGMHQRTLPGEMGVQYPYIIWSDFLEDKIIKLPYKIDNSNFLTASKGETQYILPLRRNFFKYFNVDDINEKACPERGENLVEFDVSGDKVTVTVNVPIRDTTYRIIPLSKEYSGSEIVNGNFLLGIFPFYRANDNRLNRYSVMNCGAGAKFNFVDVANLNANVNAISNIRTPQQKVVSQTEYYLLKSKFDFIEVTVADANVKGVVIPEMKQVGTATNQYKFAVDFGTSNTYIAHSTTANPTIKTLEIDNNDQQTVFLNKSNDFGNLAIMRPFIDREFAPVHIGTNYEVSYPARTATCETNNFETNIPDLFGNISIGFNMMHEPQALNIFKYKTGLKWLLENNPGDAHHTNRVKFYFLQTLWMLKNESFMNDGDDSFEVYITFPEAMKNKDSLIDLWKWAKQELNLNCTFFYGTAYSESIAPYNCLAAQIGGSSFLNIDIGGGTNDLLFVNKDANGHITSARYSSSMFAGDDLWGDGIQIVQNGQLNNGFVDYVMNLIGQAENTYSPGILSPLKSLKGGVTTSSADVMGYMFKYDSEFQTSAKIKGQRNLYSIVFIHYAALMYNVARLIKKMNIEIPLKMSFTGMGSKYIDLISSDRNVVKSLTVLLLKKYTGKEIDPAFDIISDQTHTDVKEITAKGVLKGLGLAPNFRIPTGILESVTDYGFDTDGSITYADVSTEAVRNKAMDSFNKFVDSLQERDFKNFLFTHFNNLTISEDLIADLREFAKQSFVTMSASIPVQYAGLDVTETLFFWPLKNSLVELSRNYAKYR